MNQTIDNNAIKIKGNRLYFLKLTSDLNGLYICEAFNEYGTGTGSLYWHKGEHFYLLSQIYSNNYSDIECLCYEVKIVGML